MRQLNINPKGQLVSQALYHNLGILTCVEDIAKYDMIYIYHHMSVGDELRLERDYSNIFQANQIEVFFKGFKIGMISKKSAGIICRLMDKGIPVSASIKGMSKNKYMPLNGLDIEIKAHVN